MSDSINLSAGTNRGYVRSRKALTIAHCTISNTAESKLKTTALKAITRTRSRTRSVFSWFDTCAVELQGSKKSDYGESI